MAAGDSGFRLRRLAPLAVIVALAGLVFAMGWHRHLTLETLVHHRAVISNFVDAHIAVALAAFFALYVAVVALSLPGATILTIAAGILFGVVIGGTLAIIAATIGATVIFLIAKTAFGEHLLARAGPLAVKLAQGFRRDAFSYLLFLRLVPAFPFWLVNLAPALFGVRLATFVGATALGIVPGTFTFAFLGAGLDSVIVAQERAYNACLAASRADCRLDFHMMSALTPQLFAALVALGLIALIPIALKRWRAHKSRA